MERYAREFFHSLRLLKALHMLFLDDLNFPIILIVSSFRVLELIGFEYFPFWIMWILNLFLRDRYTRCLCVIPSSNRD